MSRAFQLTTDISINTKCAPLLVDLFLYLHKSEFIEVLLKRQSENVETLISLSDIIMIMNDASQHTQLLIL